MKIKIMFLALIMAHDMNGAEIGELEKKDGKIVTNLNQYEAENFCKMQGKRLPTVRELAIDATKYGAVIEEKGKFGSEEEARQNGFSLKVTAKADGGIEDQFYYNRRAFNPELAGELKSYWIWSSSLLHGREGKVAFAFSGWDGIIAVDYRNNSVENDAVRCVSNSNEL